VTATSTGNLARRRLSRRTPTDELSVRTPPRPNRHHNSKASACPRRAGRSTGWGVPSQRPPGGLPHGPMALR
jgi:hypothetical protein